MMLVVQGFLLDAKPRQNVTACLHRLVLALLLLAFASSTTTATDSSTSSTSTTSSSSSSSTNTDKARRPNFVIFFMDDLGYGDLGFTGHPTTRTPFIDELARNGKILTSWYSGCSVCSASRAALLTGRQFPRTGVPGVLRPTDRGGLALNEITIAKHLQRPQANKYKTAIVGKWHLGQRQVYLPANHGFDYYLGIPYSDDMGEGLTSPCDNNNDNDDEDNSRRNRKTRDLQSMQQAKDTDKKRTTATTNKTKRRNHRDRPLRTAPDPAATHLPLVYQSSTETKVVEQPLDFTTLEEKLSHFATDFIRNHADDPFLLYVPFNHVHTTTETQPNQQYSACEWKNYTKRGPFGDALAEADAMVGDIMQTLRELQLEENTLILFTSDNGPWLARKLNGGSAGLLTGQYSGYWNTGKGSTWEGGIRMPAFAYWKGKIEPYSRSSEVLSSLDIFPTLSKLAGLELPSDRVYDGKDMSEVLLNPNGQSPHEFLFFYGTCHIKANRTWTVAAVRHGSYKAHFCTGPGSGVYSPPSLYKTYTPYPLLFNIDMDPSESQPLSTGGMPLRNEDRRAMHRIMKAYAFETATFVYGSYSIEPDFPGEGPGRYGICCNRTKACDCSSLSSSSDNDAHSAGAGGLFHIGTKRHHDLYHRFLGEPEPFPPQTEPQRQLQRQV